MNHTSFSTGIILRELYKIDPLPEINTLTGQYPFSPEEISIYQKACQLALGGKNWPEDRSFPKLASILQFLVPGKTEIRNEPGARHFIQPDIMGLDQQLFPRKNEDHSHSSSLISQLLAEVSDWNQPLNALLYKLEKYTATIGIPVDDLPGVSFFDHLKSVICFAHCLLRGKHSAKTDRPVALLLGGDISGIQAFIYDIVSKNAAKNLKGRSFYLELLSQSVIHAILKTFDMDMSHIVYASGGGFYLLVPPEEDFEQKFLQIRATLSEGLYREHQTKLFLALDYVPVYESDILTLKPAPTRQNQTDKQALRSGISLCWAGLSEKLNQQKRKRFSEKLVNDYETYFHPENVESGGRRERDRVTLEEFTDEEADALTQIEQGQPRRNFRHLIRFLDAEEDGNLQPVKRQTFKLIELGKELREAHYWIISTAPLPFSGYQPCQLGIYHYFFQADEPLPIDTMIQVAGKVWILRINQPEFYPVSEAYPHIIPGFTLYGGNEYPLTSEEENPEIFYPISTEELAKNNPGTDQESDFKRVGILRMDVDNLGQMFISGFSEDRKTFARYSTLSRSLDWFFKGHLNTLMKPYIDQNLAYILYSGGDDLFILGKWNATLDIAAKIRDQFERYKGFNPYINISGGVSIVTPKFPIMLAAEYAAHAEKAAKNHSFNWREPSKGPVNQPREKNAFTLFGVPLNWETEFPRVRELQEELYREVFLNQENHLRESLFGKIRKHYRDQVLQTQHGLTPRWYWMLVYDFSQIIRRLKKGETAEGARNLLEQLKIDAIKNTHKNQPTTDNYSYLKLMNLAARWADFQHRTLPETQK